jgi:hypothetical protein
MQCQEHKKIHNQVVEYTNPYYQYDEKLPTYFRYHIKTGLELDKIKEHKEEDKKRCKTNPVKLERYQNVMKSQQPKLKRNKRRKEDAHDELILLSKSIQ